MTNTTEPLKFYKVPLYYCGLLTLVSIGLVIDSIFYKTLPADLQIPSVISALVFGYLTYFMWDTTCKYCKRPFSKKEIIEWREDLGVKKEPYTYHTTVYEYSDGTRENAPNSEKTIMRGKKYDRHYYVCKKCEYGSDKEWNEEKGKWLGEAPKPKIIKKKGTAFDVGDDSGSNRKKPRKPFDNDTKRKVKDRAGDRCQVCPRNGKDIHHIDKDRTNNRLSNLIFLCPTCHDEADRGHPSQQRLRELAKRQTTSKVYHN